MLENTVEDAVTEDTAGALGRLKVQLPHYLETSRNTRRDDATRQKFARFVKH